MSVLDKNQKLITGAAALIMALNTVALIAYDLPAASGASPLEYALVLFVSAATLPFYFLFGMLCARINLSLSDKKGYSFWIFVLILSAIIAAELPVFFIGRGYCLSVISIFAFLIEQFSTSVDFILGGQYANIRNFCIFFGIVLSGFSVGLGFVYGSARESARRLRAQSLRAPIASELENQIRAADAGFQSRTKTD